MSTNPMADEGYAIALLRRAMTSGVPIDHDGIAEETGCPVTVVRDLHQRMTTGRLPESPPVGTAAPHRVEPARAARVLTASKQAPARPAPPGPRVVVERWRQAAGHPIPELARAHDTAVDLIREIEAALDYAAAHQRADADLAKARAAKDTRDAQLRDAKERLRAERTAAREAAKAAREAARAQRPPGASRLVDGRDHPCQEPGCGRVFDTVQGLSLHGRRAHSGGAA